MANWYKPTNFFLKKIFKRKKVVLNSFMHEEINDPAEIMKFINKIKKSNLINHDSK